ncbi:hypothetical protein [Megasphaera stantonii]|uniref:hypothetical protein n=1 Tax=Megasphaera stantonii TaxID=2144175 RepID=UPI001957385F|nr:hypothetical protein [Megasphaera stantonii]MBM6733543.1 hypothetical protein [Megasphaera stantonii]
MFEYNEKLNYKITEENYIKDIQELFKNTGLKISVPRNNDLCTLSCNIKRNIRNQDVIIGIEIKFDKQILHEIKLTLIPTEENDTANYDMDLKLFYHEEIKGHLLDLINRDKQKFTLRVYKSIYNSSPIYGFHETNGSNKIAFHTLNNTLKESVRNEPSIEHIVCFDLEVEERNFERAKSRANNIIADYCGYLAVLLDVGFHEPKSKYVNFIRRDQSKKKFLIHERYRTAFFDPELNLYVKDNINGLCTTNDLKHGNFNNGYYSISLDEVAGINTLQLKEGEISAIEKIFSSHRLYKVKKMMQDIENKDDEKTKRIKTEIHFINQPIYIPCELRKFIRGIEKYKKEKFEKYQMLRNACRLYNTSKVLSLQGASIEISFLVISIEALSKIEKEQSFSSFVMKYNKDASKSDLDALYSIRSKLFHSGNFSFFEFELDINPYSDPLYIEFLDKYVLFKSILRKAFINWIDENIIKENEGQ